MSKPLQGSLFKLFRSVIMGWAHVSTIYNPYDTMEERVEKNDQNTIVTKGRKMTYAQAVKCENAVEEQNEEILKNRANAH